LEKKQKHVRIFKNPANLIIRMLVKNSRKQINKICGNLAEIPKTKLTDKAKIKAVV